MSIAGHTRRGALAVLALTVVAATAAFAASLNVSSDTVTAFSTSTSLQTTTTTAPTTTTTAAGTTTCTMTASADTFISNVATSTNNGGATTMNVDRRDQAQNIRTIQSLVKFSTTSCLPAGKTLVKVELSLRPTVVGATADIIGVCPAAASWTEATTWGAAPADLQSRTACAGSTSNATATGLVANTSEVWDVSAHVSTAGVPPTQGWIVRNVTSGTITDNSGHLFTFATRESANDPELILTYIP